ncbi:MAG: PHB depolymerase family esterase [Solirubrobacteraceae bacterium]
MRRRTVLITLAACGAAVATAVGFALTSQSSAPGVGRYQHARVDAGGDIYRYAVYVPSGYRASSAVPLVVVLHGCNSTADQQTAASGYDAIAEQHRFVVLYPDVDSVDEAHGRCWKGIWDPRAEGRGRGDAGAIADMTGAVMARWHIDRARVYAIGISAGAFETSILGADYPDLYAAIGIHSGASYMGGEPGCLAANQSAVDTDALARAALAAMGTRARVMPVIVFDRLSRVRSGDVVDARVGIGCQPVSRSCSSVRRGTRDGTGFGFRDDRARLAGTSGNRGVMSRRRECRQRVPRAGNLADGL